MHQCYNCSCFIIFKTPDIKELVTEAHFIYKSRKLSDILSDFKEKRLHLAIVTDEYGGMLGIVTMEDLLEELVGEIWDEDDVVEESTVEVSEGVYLVDADESVADLFDTLGYEDPEQDEELINTLMGEWAYEQFPSIPKAGDSFRYHQIHVTVKTMVHNRIMKLQVTILPEETEGGEAE